MSYYKVLQVSEEAEPEVIEAAYKRLSQKYHPDVNRSPEAETRMKEINEAYQILRNPSTRQEYDEWLKQQTNSNPLQQTNSEPSLFDAFLNIATSVNESLGTPCPNCGTKSLIHQKKLDKGILDYITGAQKYQCRNCGYVYSI